MYSQFYFQGAWVEISLVERVIVFCVSKFSFNTCQIIISRKFIITKDFYVFRAYSQSTVHISDFFFCRKPRRYRSFNCNYLIIYSTPHPFLARLPSSRWLNYLIQTAVAPQPVELTSVPEHGSYRKPPIIDSTITTSKPTRLSGNFAKKKLMCFVRSLRNILRIERVSTYSNYAEQMKG